MEHLSTETLARLVDDAPTAEETEHLDGCGRCAAELDALREQTAALRGLPEIMPPKGDWLVLEARLRSEGLVESPGLFQKLGLAHTPAWMRAAAAVFLFISGAGTGAAFANDPGTPPEPGLHVAEPTNVETAASAVKEAEQRYMVSLARYQELLANSGGETFTEDPVRRLSALEQLVTASQAAVRHAPADQFLNGVLAVALAERDATARRLGTVSRGSWF